MNLQETIPKISCSSSLELCMALFLRDSVKQVVQKPYLIAFHYITTGDFLVDLVATVPWDLLLTGSGDGDSTGSHSCSSLPCPDCDDY